jgi:hypothetical protein
MIAILRDLPILCYPSYSMDSHNLSLTTFCMNICELISKFQELLYNISARLVSNTNLFMDQLSKFYYIR